MPSMLAGYCGNTKSPEWCDGDSKVHSWNSCKLFEKGKWKGETSWWMGGHLWDCENCDKAIKGKACVKEPIKCKFEMTEERKDWEKRMSKKLKEAKKEGILCVNCINSFGIGEDGLFACSEDNLGANRHTGNEKFSVTLLEPKGQRRKKCKYFWKIK